MRADESRGARVWLAVTAATLVGGVALRWGALATPVVSDDFAQRAMLHGTYPVRRGPLDLYDFADGSAHDTQALVDAGSLPWWSHPHIKYAMLRPLSSALLWLDDAMFGPDSRAAHVHSMIWWVLAAAAVAMLLRSLLPARAAAIGTLLFVVSAVHTWPIAWLANRNALVSVAFGAGALWAYARWRERGARRDAVIAAAAFAVALAAGELGLCFAAYVAAFEAFAARGTARARVVGLVPAIVPFAGYAVAYRALGCGAFGSGVYVDPIAEPALFARIAPTRMIALLSDLLAGTPAETREHVSTSIVVATVAVAILVTAAAIRAASRRLEPTAAKHVPWLAVGALLAVVPVLASFVSARLLLPAEVGACAAFAVVIEGALRAARDRGGVARAIAARTALIVVAATVAYVHVGVATQRTRREVDFWRRFYAGTEDAIAGAPIDRDRLAESTVVLVSAADPHTLLYAPSVWQSRGLPRPRAWRVLSMAPGVNVVRRVADDTIEVGPARGSLLATQFETLFRSPDAPLRPGDEVHLDGMTATIVSTSDTGPRVVRFRFAQSLDAPTTTLLVSELGELRRFHAPPVGSSIAIAPASIPMRLVP
jgi:hypothetical protein